jgi:hypothetical protein
MTRYLLTLLEHGTDYAILLDDEEICGGEDVGQEVHEAICAAFRAAGIVVDERHEIAPRSWVLAGDYGIHNFVSDIQGDIRRAKQQRGAA